MNRSDWLAFCTWEVGVQMLAIRKFFSNSVPLESLERSAIQAVQSSGYSLPLEEARTAFRDALGFPDSEELNPLLLDDAHGQALIANEPVNDTTGGSTSFSEFFRKEGFKNFPPLLSEPLWSTMFRLQSEQGFCMMSLVSPRLDWISRDAKPAHARIGLTIVSPSVVNDEVARLQAKLQEGIQEITEWVEEKELHTRFAELRETFAPPAYKDEEYRIAGIIGENNLSSLLQRIRATGVGMLRPELSKKLKDIKDIDDLVGRCQQWGLLETKVAVICRANSAVLAVAPSQDAYDTMIQQGVLCGSCNKPFSAERKEEILTVTPLVSQMLNKSEWMTVCLVKTLIDLGVEPENILVNVVEGSDEIDAFVAIRNDLIMFELKDSAFSLGHAYAFAARIGLNQPIASVIWAIGGVEAGVKELFKKTPPKGMLLYSEGFSGLKPELLVMFHIISNFQAKTALKPLANANVLPVDIPEAIVKELSPYSDFIQSLAEA